MKEILYKLDNENKFKESIIVKLQWSKGEIKDEII
jgi:hypothetical protein